ncbi:MAG TPA: prephenate dehydratase [Dehalococcoidia bacterium]|jgi:prephenate dehydratase|nr:prephenate dehydratase [Dehalococcoidia bacterium]|tara:strand:+ start:1394 stop:2224 length:831 start_codon:yes stop_codon:yes gene_type:complete
MPKTLAYLGPRGTFTEEAAIRYNPDLKLQSEPTIVSVGAAVLSSPNIIGIIPIENSLEGAVTYSQDLLISEPSLSIYGEIILPINHYLITQHGRSKDEIEIIYSHPQSFAQCKNYLEKNFLGINQVASLSNALAVTTMLASQNKSAAIAPQRTATIYDAAIIDSKIQDQSNNETRFVILNQQDHQPTGNDKTSICISFKEDKPGSLYKVLGIFAEKMINLTKVESRPTKETLGRYHFLIDCLGHRTEPILSRCLTDVGNEVFKLSILGSYPIFENH